MSDNIQVKVSSVKFEELQASIEKSHEHLNQASIELLKSGPQYSKNKFLNEQGLYSELIPGEEFNPFIELTEYRLDTLEVVLNNEKVEREQAVLDLNTRIDNLEMPGDVGGTDNYITGEQLQGALTATLNEARSYTDTRFSAIASSSIVAWELLSFLPDFNLNDFKNTSLSYPLSYYNIPILNYYGNRLLSSTSDLSFDEIDIMRDTIIINWSLIKQYKNQTPTLISIPSAILTLTSEGDSYLLKSTVRKDDNYFDFIYDSTTKKIESNAFVVSQESESISSNTTYNLAITSIKVLKGGN